MTRAAVRSSTSSWCAVRRSSRTPSPPARRTPGGSRPQDSSRVSTSRTALKAWAAADRSTWSGGSSVVATGGAVGVCRWTTPPRRCSATSRGSTTVSGPTATSSSWASSHSTGVRAADGSVKGRRAFSSRPCGGPHTRCSRASRAPSGDVASSAATRPRAARAAARRSLVEAIAGPRPAGAGPSASTTVRTRRRSSSARRRARERGSGRSPPRSRPELPAGRAATPRHLRQRLGQDGQGLEDVEGEPVEAVEDP